MSAPLNSVTLGSFWGLGGMALYVLQQAVPSHSELIGFLSNGVIVALVLWLLKRQSAMSEDIAVLKTSLADLTSDVHRRLEDEVNRRLDNLEKKA